MNEIYERIIEQTEKQEITGKELGKLLGLKKSPLTDWKNQKSKPTIEQLAKMCDIFAISADYLLFGKAIPITEKEITIFEMKLIEDFRLLEEEEQEMIRKKIKKLLPDAEASPPVLEQEEKLSS